jgi:hypothetical protein
LRKVSPKRKEVAHRKDERKQSMTSPLCGEACEGFAPYKPD